MQIQVDRSPMSRGVTHLMYVGDDEAVEKAVTPSTPAIGVGVVAAIVALQSHGVTRLVATGIAGYIGYRMIKARR